jgi:hypothetical protein
MSPLWFGAQHLLLVPEIRDEPMDKSAISETLRALRREISDIQSENRVFWAHTTHTWLEIQLHEKRRGRLKEIRKELSGLVRKPG